ncbi:MAG: hypothetical protein IPJ71_05685 [Bdellovibrionales bacterium]|nr:hypothetical protein [Bdellovibrionales bacterium]
MMARKIMSFFILNVAAFQGPSGADAAGCRQSVSIIESVPGISFDTGMVRATWSVQNVLDTLKGPTDPAYETIKKDRDTRIEVNSNLDSQSQGGYIESLSGDRYRIVVGRSAIQDLETYGRSPIIEHELSHLSLKTLDRYPILRIRFRDVSAEELYTYAVSTFPPQLQIIEMSGFNFYKINQMYKYARAFEEKLAILQGHPALREITRDLLLKIAELKMALDKLSLNAAARSEVPNLEIDQDLINHVRKIVWSMASRVHFELSD